MPRTHTPAGERTQQNHELVDKVATELGVDGITVRAAQEHMRAKRGVNDIVRRDIPLNHEDVSPVGVVLAKVEGMRTLAGGMCSLSLTTNAREFGDVALESSIISQSEILVCALYVIPRGFGLPDDDEGDG